MINIHRAAFAVYECLDRAQKLDEQLSSETIDPASVAETMFQLGNELATADEAIYEVLEHYTVASGCGAPPEPFGTVFGSCYLAISFCVAREIYWWVCDRVLKAEDNHLASDRAFWRNETGKDLLLQGLEHTGLSLSAYPPAEIPRTPRTWGFLKSAVVREHALTKAYLKQPLDSGPTMVARKLSPSEQRILDVLVDTGHRLTTDQILKELELRFGQISEGTTKQTLAALVRHNVIDNRSDCVPRGYGLFTWS